MIYLLIIVVILMWLVMPVLGAIATIILPWALGMSLVHALSGIILWVVAITCLLGGVSLLTEHIFDD